MKRLICIRNKSDWLQYLKDEVRVSGTKSGYLDWAQTDLEIRQRLEASGIKPIEVPVLDDEFRKSFLQEYTDLVASTGRDTHSRDWWCSAMASKNRFTSKLPDLLHQFAVVAKAMESGKYDDIVMINPPWPLIRSLQRASRENGFAFFGSDNRLKRYYETAKARLRETAVALFGILKYTWRKYRICSRLGPALKKISRSRRYYVVKTFIYEHSFQPDHSYRDAFFGSLTDYLKSKNDLLIYANILGDYRTCVEAIRRCSSHAIFPVEMFLSAGDLWRAFIRVVTRKMRVTGRQMFFGYDVTDLLNDELCRTYHGIPFDQLLHYDATCRLAQTVPIDHFLLTYENNPWERMCIMAIREQSPGCTVIGYQHTVVPQASANMFPGLGEKDISPMPDRILTVGAAPKDIMERYGRYREGVITAACGLRFEYLFSLPVGQRKRTGQILVALEGIFEVYKMVNYVLKELAGNDRYQIRIRTHPVLPMEHFRHKLTLDVRQAGNVRLSEKTQLKEDIEWADLVIYWGTTVALEAMSMGKPSIHYEMNSVLSYDPLFECDYFKRVVSDDKLLAPVIEEIYALTDDQFNRERLYAQQYLNRYFHPITPEELDKFLWHK